MAVRIEPLETAALRPALGALLKACDSLQWAVAWATENDVVPELLKNLKKVERIVIGTHFCQTSPTLLAKLAGRSMDRDRRESELHQRGADREC